MAANKTSVAANCYCFLNVFWAEERRRDPLSTIHFCNMESWWLGNTNQMTNDKI